MRSVFIFLANRSHVGVFFSKQKTAYEMRISDWSSDVCSSDLLILDEPTNHLDVDAREALVQALGGFDGAVLLVSHDRHMPELTADRLILVDDGTACEYDGSMDDYVDMILGDRESGV